MILLAGIVESIATRKDRTVKLTIGSNELNPAQASELFSLANQFCYIGLKAEPFVKEEQSLLQDLKADYDNAKTPSQRLRGILYRLYEQDQKGYKDFTAFYQGEMDRICEHYKGKLDAEAY